MGAKDRGEESVRGKGRGRLRLLSVIVAGVAMLAFAPAALASAPPFTWAGASTAGEEHG